MTETYTIATDEQLHSEVCRQYGEVVYFLFAKDVGKVKIGTSYRPGKRFGEIQQCSPVPLFYLGCVPGGADEEAKWHREFAWCHSHGEWFNANDTLLCRISSADMLRKFREMPEEDRKDFVFLLREFGLGDIPDSAVATARARRLAEEARCQR